VLSGNNITSNVYAGISLGSDFVNDSIVGSNNNTISGNNIVENYNGIEATGANFTNIFGNNLTSNSNGLGILIEGPESMGSVLHYNNIIDNAIQVELQIDYSLAWDNGFEGNYWSDFDGVDSNHDGISDIGLAIGLDSTNVDHFPLMGPFHSFNTTLGLPVNVISNSTIESFQYFASNSTIIMHVSNVTANQTRGFCRISIPYEVMSEPFNVTIDGANPTYWNYTLYDNGTHRWIYFEYEHSTKEVVIIPEFPSFIIISLFMVATLLAVIAHRKKHPKMIARKKKRGVGLNPSRSL